MLKHPNSPTAKPGIHSSKAPLKAWCGGCGGGPFNSARRAWQLTLGTSSDALAGQGQGLGLASRPGDLSQLLSAALLSVDVVAVHKEREGGGGRRKKKTKKQQQQHRKRRKRRSRKNKSKDQGGGEQDEKRKGRQQSSPESCDNTASQAVNSFAGTSAYPCPIPKRGKGQGEVGSQDPTSPEWALLDTPK